MRSIAKNLLFVLILGSVSAGFLLGIKAYTEPLIKKYQEETVMRRAILEAAELEFNKENMAEVYLANVKQVGTGAERYYVGPNGNYIFEYYGKGLWGDISGLVTLNQDLKTVEKLVIVSQSETPGLGGRITEAAFLKQFKQKVASPKLIMIKEKSGKRNDTIEVITGATLTTEALIDMVNESIEDFRNKQATRGSDAN